MSSEDLVQKVVEEVLRRLNFISSPPASTASRHRRVMVVITGGTIGAQAALNGLARLKEQMGTALQYIVLFSRVAAQIHQPEETARKLQAAEILVEGKNARGRATAALKLCNLVVVPVLTRATAARLASLILDSAASEVLADALMRGLPVVAARDAADPSGEGFARLGMNKGNPALAGAMTSNLERIASYGVNLVPASDFGEVVERWLSGKAGPETLLQPFSPAAGSGCHEEVPVLQAESFLSSRSGHRVIITSAELNSLVDTNGVVKVPKGAVITPLAQDIIRDAGWRVEEG